MPVVGEGGCAFTRARSHKGCVANRVCFEAHREREKKLRETGSSERQIWVLLACPGFATTTIDREEDSCYIAIYIQRERLPSGLEEGSEDAGRRGAALPHPAERLLPRASRTHSYSMLLFLGCQVLFFRKLNRSSWKLSKSQEPHVLECTMTQGRQLFYWIAPNINRLYPVPKRQFTWDCVDNIQLNIASLKEY